MHLLGRNEEALPLVEQSLRKLPNDPSILHTRGRVREALGQRDAAVKDYRLGLRFDFGHPENRAELARLGELVSRQR